MNKLQIYTNDWLKIHPYTAVQPSDSYFVNLSNKISCLYINHTNGYFP